MKLPDLPAYSELHTNISLVIGNSHFSDSSVRPLVPAYIEVGGIQIKPKPSPLEKDLEEFLDKSENGAIFFSMGSNVKVSSLDPKIIKVLYNVLSKVKQIVIWKWENPEKTPGNSKNIFYSNWLPQDDILANKKVKLFITHGGKGSIVEAQYHEVPMIALPVFGDQPSNSKTMTAEGYGLELDYQKMTEDDFRKTIEEVLSNATYTDAVKRFSKVYRDRPMQPRDTAVYWIEYVMRHHGAAHMQSPLVFMNGFTQYSLDVIAFLLIVGYVVFKVSKYFICFVIKKVFRTRKLKQQ